MRNQESRDWYVIKREAQNMQLFRERLSKNVHVTIPKGIVSVLRSLKFFKEI